MWPSLTEKYRVTGAVVSMSDVHRGIGIRAGLDAVDSDRLAGGDFSIAGKVAIEEFSNHDFVYLHAGLNDEVVHGTDIKAKVGGVESFDRDLVGPLLEGLAKQGPYRFLVVCDHAEGMQGQAFYGFGEGGRKNEQAAGRRFTETDAQRAKIARDPTKFVTKLFAQG